MERRKRILVVDDSVVVLEVTRLALEQAGYDVITHSSPIGTGAVVVREDPDLLLVDVSMPLLEGGEVIQLLRCRDTNVRHRPILLYSSRPEGELSTLAQSCGADGYVKKSDDFKPLLATLARHLESKIQAAQAGYTLFVDDDEKVIEGFRRTLDTTLPAQFVTSGREALRRIQSVTPPRFVVSDVYLPDLSGDEIYTEAVRGNASWRRRFVFLTGAILSSKMLEVIRESRAPFMSKPIETARVVQVLRQLEAAMPPALGKPASPHIS